MIKRILSFIFIFCFSVNLSYADVRSERNDDSCIPQYGFDRIINILATVGIYYWFSHDFHMVHPNAETAESCNTTIPSDPTNGKATGKVKFYYQPSFFGAFDAGDAWADSLGADEKKDNGLIYLRGKQVGDALCIQWAMTLGYRTVGCKYVDPPSNNTVGSSKCYINASLCSDRSFSESANLLPITGPLVQCVIDAISVFLLGHTLQQDKPPEGCETALNRFQDNLRTTVKILLVLYMVFFGMKMILSPQPPQKSEIFMFVIKMVLVTYFSVGFSFSQFGTDTDQSTGIMWLFESALKSILQLIEIAGYSGSASALCKFDGHTYSAGYEYMKVFDYLDCRILYYLGLNSVVVGGNFLLGSILGLLGILWNPIFLFMFLLILVYALLFISVIIHVVHSFVIGLISLTILIFLAPIFVPMALFQATKQMFEGWFTNVLAHILTPTILMAFCAFMFNVMDNVVYPGCDFIPRFDRAAQAATALGIEDSYSTLVWQVRPSSTNSDDAETCRSSFGYLMQQVFAFGDTGDSMTIGEFFNKAINSMTSLLTAILFMFLFYFFVDMLDSIAADLSGAPSASAMMSIPANVLAKAALNKAGSKFQEGVKKMTNQKNKSQQKRGGGSGGVSGGGG